MGLENLSEAEIAEQVKEIERLNLAKQLEKQPTVDEASLEDTLPYGKKVLTEENLDESLPSAPKL